MTVIDQLVAQDLRRYLEEEGHVFVGENTICPFHPDTQPSLHVSRNEKGEWLWCCHGACGVGGNIIHYAMKKNDWDKSRAIRELAARFHLDNEKQEPIASFSYVDEQGKELFKILRYPPKEFRTKPAGIRASDRVLYHLDEVKAAQTVWVVEGEKDADNTRKLGLTATTWSHGVTAWQPHYADCLAGKDVIICLDRGYRNQEEAAAQDIAKVARSVKVVELPGLSEKDQDITDWIEQHDAQDTTDLKAELEKIAAETPVFGTAPKVEAKPYIKGRDVKLINLHVEAVVENLIFKDAINILHGRGGAGKTWLGFQIARAVSLGLPVFGLQTQQMPVFYCDFESPAPVLIDRVKVLDIDEVNFTHAALSMPPPKLDSKEWEWYKTLEPGLLFIDSFRSCFDGDENSTEDVAPIMGKLKEVRDRGTTIAVIHHNTKDGKRYRGSTAIIDLADNVLDFHRCKKENPNEEDENDVGGFDPTAMYSLGTGEKTRYTPWKVFLNFDPLDGGYTPALDENIDVLDAVAEHLAESGCDTNQTQILKWAKEANIGPKKKASFTNILKRGEREGRWHSRKEGNQRIYTLGQDPRRRLS